MQDGAMISYKETGIIQHIISIGTWSNISRLVIHSYTYLIMAPVGGPVSQTLSTVGVLCTISVGYAVNVTYSASDIAPGCTMGTTVKQQINHR